MSRKKLLLLRTIAWILVVLCMMVIGLFSCENSSESSARSTGTVKMIVSLFMPDFDNMSQEAQQEILDDWHFVIRKLAHFSEFALLGFLVQLAMTTYDFKNKNRTLISFVICFIRAVADEIHQIFVPGRAGRVIDVCIDCSGAAFGIALMVMICLIVKFNKKRRARWC